MFKRKSIKKPVKSFTGFFDDNDKEIHVGHILEHEWNFKVEVIALTNGEYTGRVLDFAQRNIYIPLHSLNNGKGYTIIK